MKYSHRVQVQEVQGFLDFLVFRVTQEIQHLLVGLVFQEPQGHPETNTVVTQQTDIALFFSHLWPICAEIALSQLPHFTLLATPNM